MKAGAWVKGVKIEYAVGKRVTYGYKECVVRHIWPNGDLTLDGLNGQTIRRIDLNCVRQNNPKPPGTLVISTKEWDKFEKTIPKDKTYIKSTE